MHSVAFAARKHADFLLLVGAGKSKLGAVGAGIYRPAAQLEQILPPLIASQMVASSGNESRD